MYSDHVSSLPTDPLMAASPPPSSLYQILTIISKERIIHAYCSGVSDQLIEGHLETWAYIDSASIAKGRVRNAILFDNVGMAYRRSQGACPPTICKAERQMR